MATGRMDDDEIIRSCLNGHAEAYGEIVSRYQERAMAIAASVLMNREDAQDACQEAFIRAFQKLRDFEAGKSFKNWLTAILCHHCLDLVRRRRSLARALRDLGRERPDGGTTFPEGLASERSQDHLLKRLGPKERLSLLLWSEEGLSGDEIASALGCSRSTAHVHLYRARIKLKKFLEEGRP